MADKSLAELERDVEQARARLAADIALLRAPQTYDSARSSVMDAADEYRVQAMDTVRTKVTTASNDFVDTLKAKAAANPLAVGAIAAGVAWRLYRHPPIASLLIGAGAYALFRTDPQDDSLTPRRLYETASERALRLKDRTAAQVAELARDATGAAEERLHDLQEVAAEKLHQLQDAAGRAYDAAGRAVEDVKGRVADAASTASAKVSDAASAASAKVSDAASAASAKVSGAARSTSGPGASTTAYSPAATPSVGGPRAIGASDVGRVDPVGSLENDPTLRLPARRIARDLRDEEEGAAWGFAPEKRDAYLLGFAAIALGAAVGFARMRREEDEEIVTRPPPRVRIIG